MQIMLLNNKMVNSLLYCRRCLFLYAETEYKNTMWRMMHADMEVRMMQSANKNIIWHEA